MPFLKLRKRYRRSGVDDFIIKFSKTHSAARKYDAPLCCKRLIFISLIGLFRTYDQCPPYLLYSSLLILPLKRKWIESPQKYLHQLQSVSSDLMGIDARSHIFYEFLKWKDSQGFVFWAKDEYDLSVGELVHPFWKHVSQKLLSFHDPITSKHYEPLSFDEKYWRKQIGLKSKEKVSDVLQEMYYMTLNFKAMKRLINGSNSKSFRVITEYNDNCNEIDNEFVKCQSFDDVDDFDAKSDDEWWISTDY